MAALVYPDWKATIVYSSEGPKPQFLVESEQIKVLLAGLEPGQRIPPHADKLAMYHFLEGTGWILVDDERVAVRAGTTVITPDGAVRGMEAETRLSFIATRVA